ncbi:MAG TPA: hypothetical protein VF733_03435 [Candidatus Saccharimonadales bacterium]
MLGFGDKHEHSVDPTTLPIFVHAVQSVEAFGLAEKVWQANGRYVMLDADNRKELLRFVFNDPKCVVWLERDQGRQDTYELILLWDAKGKEVDVSEVYVISNVGSPAGDDSRLKSLLATVLASPALVPASRQSGQTGQTATPISTPNQAQNGK